MQPVPPDFHGSPEQELLLRRLSAWREQVALRERADEAADERERRVAAHEARVQALLPQHPERTCVGCGDEADGAGARCSGCARRRRAARPRV